MRFWIVEIGEPLPVDGPETRPWRAWLLCQALVERGHEVVWWASTFRHAGRRHRGRRHAWQALGPAWRLVQLHGPGYRASISWARLRHQAAVARAFARAAAGMAPPDLVFCCIPTLELAESTVRWAERVGIPAVLDYRDLWPDIFRDHLPQMLRPFARPLLARFAAMARRSFGRATAITGITDAFVEVALKHAGRRRRDSDRAFPHGYRLAPIDVVEEGRLVAWWQQNGVEFAPGIFRLCFVGTLSHRLDLGLLIEVAHAVLAAGVTAQLVCCGTGEAMARLQAMAGGDRRIVFPGWVDGPAIRVLLERSSVGIIPYPATADFVRSIPNKAIEYLAHGLPVVSTVPGGPLADLLESEGCGWTCAERRAPPMRDLLVRLAADPWARERASLAAHRVFRQNFQAETVYRDLAGHLEGIVAARTDELGRGPSPSRMPT